MKIDLLNEKLTANRFLRDFRGTHLLRQSGTRETAFTDVRQRESSVYVTQNHPQLILCKVVLRLPMEFVPTRVFSRVLYAVRCAR